MKHELVSAILAFENPTIIDKWLSKALDVKVRRTFLNLPATGQYKDPYAMDIDRIEAGEDNDSEKSTRKTYLTPQECDGRHKSSHCFKCSKKGLAKDCHNHPAVTTARKTQTNSTSSSSKDDAKYQEFLEWKAFKARQIEKGKKKEESEDEDF